VKSWIRILRYDVFQGNSGSHWKVMYGTTKKEISGRSQDQQAKNNLQDLQAEKGTTESDKTGDDEDMVCKGWPIKPAPAPRPSTVYCANEDMDITECMPLCNMTSSTSSSHMGKETNTHSADCSDICKVPSVQLCGGFVTLPYTKKPRMKYNNDASGGSESKEEQKSSKNARKNQGRNKAHSGRTNSKSLSRNMKTRSKAVSKEAAIDRYVIDQQRELSSGM
jgi:hypothetical protein